MSALHQEEEPFVMRKMICFSHSVICSVVHMYKSDVRDATHFTTYHSQTDMSTYKHNTKK